jgi:DNA repair protein RecO (recombination protein O)
MLSFLASDKMPSYRAKAIILKSYKLGESDKIIKMYSQKDGIISAVARGSRKIKSKFGGRLELFNFVDLELATGRNLDIITQAEIIKSFKNIPLDFNKFILCQIISEVILKTHLSGPEASPLLFKLVYVCYNEIDSMPVGDIYLIEKIGAFFIAKFLKITGYSPLITSCCKCGVSIGLDNLFFSIRLGGILCRSCGQKVENTPDLKKTLSDQGHELLYYMFNYNLKKFRELQINPIILSDIYKLIGDYMKYHTECDVDVYTYINKVVNINKEVN